MFVELIAVAFGQRFLDDRIDHLWLRGGAGFADHAGADLFRLDAEGIAEGGIFREGHLDEAAVEGAEAAHMGHEGDARCGEAAVERGW